MSVTRTYYLATNGYGKITAANGPVWSTIRSATSGTATQNQLYLTTSIDGGTTYYLDRVFLPFDTRELPVGAIINSATISLYRDDSVRFFLNTQSSTLHLIPSTQADATNLVGSDFDNVTFSSKGNVAMSSTSNNTYFDITITDTSIISLRNYSKIALTNERDLNNTAPTGECFIGMQNAVAAHPPKLTINFTLPVRRSMFI